MKLTLLKIVLPLLIVHGWPGSVVEFLDIIPLLVQGNEKVTKYIVIIIIAWLSSNFKLMTSWVALYFVVSLSVCLSGIGNTRPNLDSLMKYIKA